MALLLHQGVALAAATGQLMACVSTWSKAPSSGAHYATLAAVAFQISAALFLTLRARFYWQNRRASVVPRPAAAWWGTHTAKSTPLAPPLPLVLAGTGS